MQGAALQQAYLGKSLNLWNGLCSTKKKKITEQSKPKALAIHVPDKENTKLAL